MLRGFTIILENETIWNNISHVISKIFLPEQRAVESSEGRGGRVRSEGVQVFVCHQQLNHLQAQVTYGKEWILGTSVYPQQKSAIPQNKNTMVRPLPEK